MVYVLSFLEHFGITLCAGTPLLELLLTVSVALSFSSVLIKCSFAIHASLLLALHVMSLHPVSLFLLFKRSRTHLATVLMLKLAYHFFQNWHGLKWMLLWILLTRDICLTWMELSYMRKQELISMGSKNTDACVGPTMSKEDLIVISIRNLEHFMVCFTSFIVCITQICKIAGPRLTVNCLTDHRTWYNLQV